MPARIAVLASGGGSNLQALLAHLDALGPGRPGEVVLVASDRTDAGALQRAAARGIATARITTRSGGEGTAMEPLLREHDVDLVVLAGYLRLVPPEVVDRWQARIVNVHPALLPAFGGHGMYGRRVHQAVIDSGAWVSGATVHLVDREYDRGRILAQWPVPVLATDVAETLAARVLAVEHLLLPRVVEAIAAGRIPGTTGRPASTGAPAFLSGALDEARIAHAVDAAFAAR